MKWQSARGFHWLDEAPYRARIEETGENFFWIVTINGETFASRYASDLSKAMCAAELCISVAKTLEAISTT